MLFSSIPFLYYFLPLTLLCYFLAPRRAKNAVLLLFSLVFYAWGEPKYVLFMVVSILQGYFFGRLVEKYRISNPRRSKLFLTASVLFSLLLLGYCKYADFFIRSFNAVTGLSVPLLRVALPLGISFYTFQTLSYSIDVYRRDVKAERNIIDFGAYVVMFPQLIAGPIVRYRDVDRQLLSRTHTVDRFASGVRRFAVGFGKKILLGDALAAVYAYLSTAADFEFTVLSGWLMVATYTLHIYFDFSGYSDMAIGLGRMFGFEFPENFRYPYMASSITDFWRRWHITLSTWFREYVYIPLGGNRRGRARQYFNLAVVWLLTGLWHGASWNFVLWGLFYLILLVAEKAFLLRLLERNRLTRVLGHIGALLLVGIGWMIFDHTDLGEALRIIGGLFGIGTAGFAAATVSWLALRLLPLLAVSVAAATPYPTRLWNRLTGRRPALTVLEPVLLVAVLALSVACAVRSDYSPFLYFNF